MNPPLRREAMVHGKTLIYGMAGGFSSDQYKPRLKPYGHPTEAGITPNFERADPIIATFETMKAVIAKLADGNRGEEFARSYLRASDNPKE